VNLARYHGEFAHGAHTTVVAGMGAACAGLMRFTQRHQLDRIFPWSRGFDARVAKGLAARQTTSTTRNNK